MRASEVIELYIVDTVRLLPRRQREDVAEELRSLLGEELHARAQKQGAPADKAMALALLRDYGPPSEAAARYRQPWAIIDPADTTSFLRATVIGAAAIALLSALSSVRPDLPADPDKHFLIWLGILVVFFGLRHWMRDRWPSITQWKPKDHDKANRIGILFVIPIALLAITLYAAPAWFLDTLLGGRLDTSWAHYTPEFQRTQLPWFISFMLANVAMLAAAAILGRWNRWMRRIGIAIDLVIIGLVMSFAIRGNVFPSAEVDRIARDVLALIAVGYVPLVGWMLFREIGRIEYAAAPKPA